MTNVMAGLPIVLIDLLNIYEWIIVIWALLTWLPGASQSKLGLWLGKLVNPLLSFFDRFIPPIFGISFSPIFAFLLIGLIKKLVLMVF
ncbi:YggT family protein [Bombilactobacillus thymidiniphilus]|uniref:YggT family protein n=1 Tax=Bombilactobacillus thymidiniphilus TaxID=2923363 RepID=A0ABY4PER2_9LACO|nr:YggT family protein [Bombilactobacillus thymidiniphilus]UQS83787.1 YggT family protein [Bombilactobacillus thymidiniphilus]